MINSLLTVTLLVFSLSVVAEEPTPPPKPCTAPEHHEFDFWLGKWTAYSKDGQKQGTNHLHTIMDGCGIQENWVGASGAFKGTSYNFYMPRKGLWHQTWVDNSGGRLLMEGGFKDGSMQVLFEPHDVVWKKSADQDPYSFLPGWLHTR